MLPNDYHSFFSYMKANHTISKALPKELVLSATLLPRDLLSSPANGMFRYWHMEFLMSLLLLQTWRKRSKAADAGFG